MSKRNVLSLIVFGFFFQLFVTTSYGLGIIIPKRMSNIVTDEFIRRIDFEPELIAPVVNMDNPLSISRQTVDVTIKDQVSKTKIDQVFHNSTRRVLEGSFIFPLPAEATVSDFGLYINGKRKPGEMLEAQKAKQIYEAIVAKKIDPALLEYVGKDLFKARIFPFPALGDRRLDITFDKVLKLDGGLCRYVLPLRAPRNLKTPIKEFTMTVNLSSQRAIKSIYSPSHTIDVVRKGEHEAVISFEEENLKLDKDFVLIYSVDDKSFGCSLLTHRFDEDEDGFFMLLLTPRQTMKEEDILPKDVTFVVDTSGSMNGEKMEKAKAALLLCVNSLEEKDNFNVIGFSTDTKPLFKSLKPASDKNIKKARHFIDRKLRAAGGTAIDAALKEALKHTPAKGRPYMVVFVTDGKPTIGPRTIEEITKNVKAKIQSGTRLFTLGVGHKLNTKLLDTLSSNHRGVSEYITPKEDIEIKMSNFYAKIASPVLADIELDFGEIEISEQYPKEIGDLFKGGQIEIIGRYANEGNIALKLSGITGNKKITLAYDAEFPKEEESNEFLQRIWAQRKVAYLMDEIRLNGMNQELKDEIIRLGKEYCIQTPYTSFLVVEDGEMMDGDFPVRPPRPRPVFRRDFIGRPMSGEPMPEDAGAVPEMSKQSLSDSIFGGTDSADYSVSSNARGISPVIADKREKISFEATSGEEAVSTSMKLKEMKKSTVVETNTSSSVEIIGARTFYLKNGVWTDSKYEESMDKLEIKHGSAAWLNLLTTFENLNGALTLSENIIIVYKGKAIVVSKDKGATEKSASALKKFFK